MITPRFLLLPPSFPLRFRFFCSDHVSDKRRRRYSHTSRSNKRAQCKHSVNPLVYQLQIKLSPWHHPHSIPLLLLFRWSIDRSFPFIQPLHTGRPRAWTLLAFNQACLLKRLLIPSFFDAARNGAPALLSPRVLHHVIPRFDEIQSCVLHF
jgi:hypothetical protein